MHFRKIDDKKSNLLLTIILVVYLIIASLIPFLIWLEYHKMSWESWNSMILSYTGGTIGGIATLIAIYLTLKQNDKNYKKTVELQLDLKRVDVLPFLSIEAITKEDFSKSFFSNDTDKQYDEDYTNKNPSGYFIFENNSVSFCPKLAMKYKIELSNAVRLITESKSESCFIGSFKANNSFEQPLKLTNIGLGPAINVKLDLYNNDDKLLNEYLEIPFNVKINQESIFRLVFMSYPEGKYYFNFTMSDVHGKCLYCQRYDFQYKQNYFICGNIESPKLINI